MMVGNDGCLFRPLEGFLVSHPGLQNIYDFWDESLKRGLFAGMQWYNLLVFIKCNKYQKPVLAATGKDADFIALWRFDWFWGQKYQWAHAKVDSLHLRGRVSAPKWMQFLWMRYTNTMERGRLSFASKIKSLRDWTSPNKPNKHAALVSPWCLSCLGLRPQLQKILRAQSAAGVNLWIISFSIKFLISHVQHKDVQADGCWYYLSLQL